MDAQLKQAIIEALTKDTRSCYKDDVVSYTDVLSGLMEVLDDTRFEIRPLCKAISFYLIHSKDSEYLKKDVARAFDNVIKISETLNIQRDELSDLRCLVCDLKIDAK